ncbi:MAG: hypothetical protein FJX72_14855 [Armatimonadetes bacterium]|nr:hypothetical protein [Armatimonadota bacterium]
MKTEIPPWVAVVAIVAIILLGGFFIYRNTGPGGGKAARIEDAIRASAAVPGKGGPSAPGPPGAGPGGIPMPPPNAQAPGTAPR